MVDISRFSKIVIKIWQDNGSSEDFFLISHKNGSFTNLSLGWL